MKINNIIIKFFFATVFACSFLCSCKRCGVGYLSESDLKNQKKQSIVQDSIIQFHCLTHYGDNNAISIHFQFITKEIYIVDSFDINITMDNNEILNLIQFNSLVSDNNYVMYKADQNKSIDLKEIIPKEHKDTKKKFIKYYNENYYDFRFSNNRAIKNEFIIVRINTKLTNDREVLKYDKEFKLFPKEHCYYD